MSEQSVRTRIKMLQDFWLELGNLLSAGTKIENAFRCLEPIPDFSDLRPFITEIISGLKNGFLIDALDTSRPLSFLVVSQFDCRLIRFSGRAGQLTQAIAFLADINGNSMVAQMAVFWRSFSRMVFVGAPLYVAFDAAMTVFDQRLLETCDFSACVRNLKDGQPLSKVVANIGVDHKGEKFRLFGQAEVDIINNCSERYMLPTVLRFLAEC